jgi:hypothetical protein
MAEVSVEGEDSAAEVRAADSRWHDLYEKLFL